MSILAVVLNVETGQEIIEIMQILLLNLLNAAIAGNIHVRPCPNLSWLHPLAQTNDLGLPCQETSVGLQKHSNLIQSHMIQYQIIPFPDDTRHGTFRNGTSLCPFRIRGSIFPLMAEVCP